MASKRSNAPSKAIAIAGATDKTFYIHGDVGSHVVEALLNANKFAVVLLLRKENSSLIEALKKRYPEASSRLYTQIVDFSPTSVDTLISTFQTHTIDTIISSISSPDPTAFISAQHALLSAAEKSPSVRRFIPNDWGSGIDKDTVFRSALQEPLFEIIPGLEKSSLNWMSIANGAFMDYWGAGAERDFIEEGSTTHMKIYPYVVDVKEGRASIPVLDDKEGEGDKQTAWTRVSDVARYVVGACLLDGVVWDGRSVKVAGWTGTLFEAIKIAERVTGKTFTVERTPVSDLAASITPSTDIMARFWTESLIALRRGQLGWEDKLGEILREHGLGFTPKSLEDTLKEVWT